jgi:hypothetical protein
MLLLSCLLGRQVPPIVRYSSVVQIKNFYSKHRLTVTTDSDGQNYEIPRIFASRPPFDDGWMWTIEPTDSAILRAREPVRCGDNISMANPIAKLYVGTRLTANGVEVIPSTHRRGDSDQWTVICRNPPHWTRDEQIQLQNAKHGCFLATSLGGRANETVNRFNVTCGGLNADAVWKAVEGVYFGEVKRAEPDEPSDSEL